MKRSVSLTILLAFLLSVFFVILSQPIHAKKKPKIKDPFYEKARFIMTKEEADIYKHTADKEDRELFIEEFWKKRDPDPSTEENENRIEFHKRIAYANKWFRERPKGGGWSTERGRILLQLGFPDRREFGQAPITGRGGRLLTSKRLPMERWWYYRYQLKLVFTDSDDSGRYSMTQIPSNLLTTMDLVRFSLDMREDYNIVKRSFRFKAVYKKGVLDIRIPVKKLSFEEKEGKMAADFHTTVYVYKNSKKIDQMKVEKSYRWSKDELLKQKTISFDFSYALKEKGKYYFEVVVEELGSSSKFRDFVKVKI
jgi:GWxTD domain-containing protein